MSMRTRVVTCDDLDGSEGASRVTFAYAGTHYEIDLGEANRTTLEAALASYIAAARRTIRIPVSADQRGRPYPLARRRELVPIRAWAREQGLPVSDKGRIPKDIQEAYDAAH